MHLGPFNSAGASSVHVCAQLPPRSLLLSFSVKAPEADTVHILRCMKWLSWAPLCSLHRLRTAPCPISSHHTEIQWSHITLDPPTLLSPLTVAALTLLFNLCLFCLSYRPAAASIMSQTRDVCQSFCLGLGLLSLLPELRVSFSRGPARHLFRAPSLPCFGAGLQHPFTFKKTSFSTWCFTKPSFIYRLQTNPSGQLERWHGELPPPCIQPPTPPRAARLQVEQHKSAEDEGSAVHTFPMGIIKRTCDRWKILSMGVRQLPCHGTTLPMNTSRDFCFASCLISLYRLPRPAVCLSLHPGGDKQMPVFL